MLTNQRCVRALFKWTTCRVTKLPAVTPWKNHWRALKRLEFPPPSKRYNFNIPQFHLCLKLHLEPWPESNPHSHPSRAQLLPLSNRWRLWFKIMWDLSMVDDLRKHYAFIYRITVSLDGLYSLINWKFKQIALHRFWYHRRRHWSVAFKVRLENDSYFPLMERRFKNLLKIDVYLVLFSDNSRVTLIIVDCWQMAYFTADHKLQFIPLRRILYCSWKLSNNG